MGNHLNKQVDNGLFFSVLTRVPSATPSSGHTLTAESAR